MKLPENTFFEVLYTTWLEKNHKSGSNISVTLHYLLPWFHVRKVTPFL